jgi:hypothetical protein
MMRRPPFTGSLTIIAITIPLFIALMVPLAIAYFYLQR